jgi:type IV fimbrial biogenesis protein FimT
LGQWRNLLDHEEGINVLKVFHKSNSPLATAKGFTMIELMIALVIIAIGVTLGMPSYSTWIQNTQIYNAAESAQNGLQKAKAEAVKSNTQVEFVFGANPPWKIQLPGNGLACPVAPGVALTTLLECSTTEGSKNAVGTATPTNATTVTFSNLGGIVVNADGSATLTQIDFKSSSLATSRNLRVTIGPGGIIRMCDNSLSKLDPRAC